MRASEPCSSAYRTPPERDPARMTDHRIAKWTRWVDGAMKDDILGMHLRRDAWQEVREIIRTNGELPDSYWWRFMF